MTPKRREDDGADTHEGSGILRAALAEVQERMERDGYQNAVTAIVTKDGAGLGYACRSPERGGWELDATLRANWSQGKVRDVRAEIAWRW